MTYFEQGSHNLQCDTCKRIIKSSQAKKSWRGYIQCSRCYDPKHPNEIPRQVHPDGEPVIDARPENRIFLNVINPTTRWDDTSLSWNDIHWRWDDDPSNGNMYGNSNNAPE